MRIGVYGDSFAQDYHNGWPFFLSNLFKCKVDTYGWAGTSAEYSYMNFLNTNENYDIIIFLWTSINRTSLIVQKNDKYEIKANCFTNIADKRNILKNVIKHSFTLNTPTKYEISEMNNWIKFEYDMLKKFELKNKIYHQSMRDSVKFARPDAINIECFSGKVYDYGFNNVYGMQNIVETQIKLLNLNVDNDGITFEENPEKIKNHLSIKKNLEFAKYIQKTIEDKNFDIHQTFTNPEKYYTMVTSIEESGYIIV